jgi:antirestriction protein ArdC
MPRTTKPNLNAETSVERLSNTVFPGGAQGLDDDFITHTDAAIVDGTKNWFDGIVDRLQGDAQRISWIKPWSGPCGAVEPRNPATGTVYTRGNRWTGLIMSDNPFWSTRVGWKKLGHPVPKDCEYGAIFWKPMTKSAEDKMTGERKTWVAGFFPYAVWNGEQVGYAAPVVEEKEASEIDAAVAEGLKMVQAYFDHPKGAKLVHLGSRAFYTPIDDTVTIPPRKHFHHDQEWLSTIVHEAGHSTGHEKRLDRLTKSGFGTGEYAFEELVAELTAAEYMAQHGLTNTRTIENSEAYIRNWAMMIIAMGPEKLREAFGFATKALAVISETGAGSYLNT